jgi:hypothetical protein
MISMLLILACQHGPVCDSHVVSFDTSHTATWYTVYWARVPGDGWESTFDICPRTCGVECYEWSDPCVLYAPPPNDAECLAWEFPVTCVTPCREECPVNIVRPDPGGVIFLSVTASNAVGEGPH